MRDKDRHTASFITATHQSQPPTWRHNNPDPNRGLAQKERASRPTGRNGPNRSRKRPQYRRRLNHSRSQRPRRAHSSRWPNVPPCTLNGQTARKYKGCSGATLKGQPKQFVRFQGKLQGRLATSGQHGHLQHKIKWQALPEWGEKAETSNLKLSDDRRFPECPVQLRTPANHMAPGTVWNGDVPQAWLEEPNIPEERQVATAINLKLRLGR